MMSADIRPVSADLADAEMRRRLFEAQRKNRQGRFYPKRAPHSHPPTHPPTRPVPATQRVLIQMHLSPCCPALQNAWRQSGPSACNTISWNKPRKQTGRSRLQVFLSTSLRRKPAAESSESEEDPAQPRRRNTRTSESSILSSEMDEDGCDRRARLSDGASLPYGQGLPQGFRRSALGGGGMGAGAGSGAGEAGEIAGAPAGAGSIAAAGGGVGFSLQPPPGAGAGAGAGGDDEMAMG